MANEQAADSKKPAADLTEIAVITNGMDVTRGWVEPLMILEPQDDVLLGRGGGDLKVYEELLRDDQVAACFQQRRLAVISAEWDVEPGGDRPIDEEAAQSLKENLAAINWDAATDKMLYGYAVAELLYATQGRRVVISQITGRNRRRFRFSGDGSLRLLTAEQPLGMVMKPQKFWTFCCGADNDDEPYGLGLGHWVYWPVRFKRGGTKFWMTFLDKYGMPTALGKYGPNAGDAGQDKLLKAASAMRTAAALVIPNDMALELMQAARAAGADYNAACEYMDRAVAKVILGQTASTEGTPGKLGNEQLQSDVRRDLIKADADVCNESFNGGPAQWLTEWNFPGAAMPRVYRKLEPPEDLASKAEQYSKTGTLGYRPTIETVQEIFGGKWEAFQKTAAPAIPADNAPALSEPQPGSPAETPFTGQLDDAAATVMDGLIEPVKKAVMQASSLEDLKARLMKLSPKMKPEEFANLMARAMAAAELAGRFSVREETP